MAEALSEKYLTYIANKYKIGLFIAAKYIDECIKKTAAKYNVDYFHVYNSLFTLDKKPKFPRKTEIFEVNSGLN